MPKGPISYDLGVSKRKHHSGVEVFMYDSEPGVYRNAYGTEVSEELAGEAGYPVRNLGKERQKGERLEEARTQIERELEVEDIGEVLAEKGGFKAVKMPFEKARVEDPDGNVLTDPSNPLPTDQALLLLDKMVQKNTSNDTAGSESADTEPDTEDEKDNPNAPSPPREVNEGSADSAAPKSPVARAKGPASPKGSKETD